LSWFNPKLVQIEEQDLGAIVARDLDGPFVAERAPSPVPSSRHWP